MTSLQVVHSGTQIAGRGKVVTEGYRLWYDTRHLKTPDDGGGILHRLHHLGYTGAVLYPENRAALTPVLHGRCELVVDCSDPATVSELPASEIGRAHV